MLIRSDVNTFATEIVSFVHFFMDVTFRSLNDITVWSLWLYCKGDSEKTIVACPEENVELYSSNPPPNILTSTLSHMIYGMGLQFYAHHLN